MSKATYHHAEVASIAPSEATTLVPGPSTTAGPSNTHSHLTKYNMYYTPSMLNCTLHLGDLSSPVHYYMQSKSATLSPRILLHRGSDKKSPVVAFAKARYTSRNMVIGLGDCEDKKHAEECTFEELSRDKNLLRRSSYRFSTEDGETGKRVELVWKKDAEGYGNSRYDAVDESGEVVARMLSGGMWNWQKGGEIWVDESLEVGLRDLLVVSAFGIWVMEALNYRSVTRGYDKGK